MNIPARRTPLGSSRHAFGVAYEVFLTREWIEVDEVDGSEIRRMRVPFDEVRLVTRHDERPILALVLVLLFALPMTVAGIFIALAGATGGEGDVGAGIVLTAIGLGFLLPVIALTARGVKVVSIYGERSKAQMRFHWRHRKADDAHEAVLVRVRRARAAAAASAAPHSPAAAEAEPPPPEA